MREVEYEGKVYIHLTYSEEQILARWTMDLLAHKGFTNMCGKVYRYVKETYDLKCGLGTDFRLDQLIALVNVVLDWNEKFEMQISTEALEAIGENNGRERTPPLKNDAGKPYTKEERRSWIRESTRQAWREVWREHPVRTAVEGFLVFPGDDPDETYMEIQMNREVRFWDEVGRRQKEYGVSRSEATKAVADYMPRGVFPEGDLPDPATDRSMLDLMEVEYPEPEATAEGDDEDPDREDERLWF